MKISSKCLPPGCLVFLACLLGTPAAGQPFLGFEYDVYPLTGQPDPGLMIPGSEPGVVYDFSDPVTDVNDAGQQLTLRGSGDQTILERVDPDGTSKTVAIINAEDEFSFTEIGDRQLINNRGVVAFWARFKTEPPISLGTGEGFYLIETEPPPRTRRTLAFYQYGNSSEELPPDYEFVGLDRDSLHLNNHNFAAYTGVLRGNSEFAFRALFVHDYQNNSQSMVARQGQVIDLDRDPAVEELHAIKRFEQVRGINDEYQIGYRVTLENNQQAIVVAKMSVPEPSSAFAVLAGIGLMGRRHYGRLQRRPRL